ncbi:MAG: dephospho-CoA kinase, partial [Opitutales bacterium]|nr:dephospho-CoA kinase [Opitutales bacterium]
MVIGLTGGMGSGKSTAARLFEDQGFQRIDCDEIAHDLLREDEDVNRCIKKAFGTDAFDRDGQVDRTALGGIVFESGDNLLRLEAILHPRIRDTWLARVASDTEARWVVEIPLLFEKNLQN